MKNNVKKQQLSLARLHLWRDRDAGSTARRDWTVLFWVFIVFVLMVAGTRALAFYNLVVGKFDVVESVEEEPDKEREKVEEAYEQYQQKKLEFERIIGSSL